MRTRILILDGRAEPGTWPLVTPELLRVSAEEAGAQSAVWSAAEHPIGSTASRHIYTPGAPTGVEHPARALMRMIRRTDGLLVVGEERHAGLGGMLSCALDTLSEAEIDRKPTAMIICSSAGRAKIVEPQLRSGLQALTATVYPEAVCCETVTADPELSARIGRLLDGLLAAATTSRVGRRDRGGYQHSPILGVSHHDVRPLQGQPDAEYSHQLLAERYSVGMND